jgi:methionyl-tRNA synthetase
VPRHLFAHGWLLFEENKMSKTRGNIVRTETILDVLGADALRYFLLREIVFGQDGSFSFDALVQRYNADLANVSRQSRQPHVDNDPPLFQGRSPYPSHTAAHKQADDAIAETARHTIAEYNTYFEQYQFSKALEAAWGLVAAVDKYIVENEPWALGEKPDEESRARLANGSLHHAEALRIVTALAHPVMPDATIKIWSQLGLNDIRKFRLADLQWGQLKLGTRLGEIGPVFPRADKSAIERMQKMEDEQRTPVATEVKAEPAASAAPAAKALAAVDGKIAIDDFAKVELRVAQVKVAEKS